jgi:hypothetical protein
VGMAGAATGGLGCEVCGGGKAVCVGCGVTGWAPAVSLGAGGGVGTIVVLFVAITDKLVTVEAGTFVGPSDFTMNAPGLFCQSPRP